MRGKSMIEVSWQDQTGRIDHEWRLINPLEIIDHRRLRGRKPPAVPD